MKVKIISDGNPMNTKVTNAETGEVIDGITNLKWQIHCGSLATVDMRLKMTDVEIVGDMVIKEVTPVGSHWKEFQVQNVGRWEWSGDHVEYIR